MKFVTHPIRINPVNLGEDTGKLLPYLHARIVSIYTRGYKSHIDLLIQMSDGNYIYIKLYSVLRKDNSLTNTRDGVGTKPAWGLKYVKKTSIEGCVLDVIPSSEELKGFKRYFCILPLRMAYYETNKSLFICSHNRVEGIDMDARGILIYTDKDMESALFLNTHFFAPENLNSRIHPYRTLLFHIHESHDFSTKLAYADETNAGRFEVSDAPIAFHETLWNGEDYQLFITSKKPVSIYNDGYQNGEPENEDLEKRIYSTFVNIAESVSSSFSVYATFAFSYARVYFLDNGEYIIVKEKDVTR